MHFAAARTTIPIPKLYRAHEHHSKIALGIEYFGSCETLQACWKTLSDQEKLSIVDEMSGFIHPLRTLGPPDQRNWVSSANGRPCRDVRIGSVRQFGPFAIAAFHECLRGGIKHEYGRQMYGDEVMRIHDRGREYKICFTHRDLGPQNILVREGKIAALVDWKDAGWYPEYWEYTKAYYNRVHLPEFDEMLSQRIELYDEELEAERSPWRQLDQPLDEGFFQGRTPYR